MYKIEKNIRLWDSVEEKLRNVSQTFVDLCLSNIHESMLTTGHTGQKNNTSLLHLKYLDIQKTSSCVLTYFFTYFFLCKSH